MELGNTVFGNSRGEYPLKRGTGFEAEFERLNNRFEPNGYVEEFENDVFTIFPYYWGECTCGYEDLPDEQQDIRTHTDDCKLLKPNFCFKPTNFQIQWYKYPFRDSYTNQQVALKEFSQIIDACIDSLKDDGKYKSLMRGKHISSAYWRRKREALDKEGWLCHKCIQGMPLKNKKVICDTVERNWRKECEHFIAWEE